MTNTPADRTERIAILLCRIYDDGRILPENGLPSDFPPAMRVMPDLIIMLNELGAASLHEIVNVLGEDPSITRNARREDVERVVWEELSSMLEADERHEMDVLMTARAIEQGIVSDLRPHTVYWPLRGMRLEDGASLTLAGMSIGPLSIEERAAIEAENMMRTGEAAIGNVIPDSQCWAHIDVVAREASLREVVHEQIELADAILRVFNPAADMTLSIDYPLKGMHHALQYNKDEAGCCTSFTFLTAVYDQRTLLILSQQEITALVSHPGFQAAQQIVAAGQPNDMEIHLLHAMLAFRSATLADHPEEQLTIYLSIIEGLYGAETGEYRSRDKRAAERLATAWPEDRQQTVVAHLSALFDDARTRPIHFGRRRLYGRVIVSREEVGRAREYARSAILYALQHADQFAIHSEFVDMLSQKVAVQPDGTTRMTYAIVVRQDPESGQYLAEVPDIASCRGSGDTAARAIGTARTNVAHHVRTRMEEGGAIPLPLTTTDKAVVQVRQPRQ